MARNWLVCVGDATDCEPGMIESETIFPPATPPPADVTVRIALELTGPLNAVALPLMVVVPAPTAVASPEALTVATAGTLEVQVTTLVTFWVERWFALPYVPVAVNCAV
jgi:hypothetical protein